MALRTTIILAAAAALAGCTTMRQDFPDADAAGVWRALVATARAPDYDDGWTVEDNDVWIDEPQRRIEVYRTIGREVRRPGARTLTERRTWRFEVGLARLDPPGVVFTSRGFGVPAHAKEEAERFFDQVWGLLAAMHARSIEGDDEQAILDSMGLDDSGATEDGPESPPAAPDDDG